MPPKPMKDKMCIRDSLITTNCCVLAVTILVVGDYGADVAAHGFGYAYIEALICADVYKRQARTG